MFVTSKEQFIDVLVNFINAFEKDGVSIRLDTRFYILSPSANCHLKCYREPLGPYTLENGCTGEYTTYCVMIGNGGVSHSMDISGKELKSWGMECLDWKLSDLWKDAIGENKGVD